MHFTLRPHFVLVLSKLHFVSSLYSYYTLLNIATFFIMKGERKLRKAGFKVGHDLHFKKVVSQSSKSLMNNVCYLRLTKKQHALVCEEGPGVDPAISGGGLRHCLLRGLDTDKIVFDWSNIYT